MNETENVSLYLVGSSPIPHSYSRKIASSSGLSGGAIAGIVIACVVVLIVTGLLFVYFNKPSPKNMDSSAIQFYNSSLSVVNWWICLFIIKIKYFISMIGIMKLFIE